MTTCPECGGPLDAHEQCHSGHCYAKRMTVGRIEFGPALGVKFETMLPVNWWTDSSFKDATTPCPTPPHYWDTLFMRIAREIATMSKCASRQIGVVIVRDKQMLSMGYNGSPAGSNFCQFPMNDVSGSVRAKEQPSQCPRKRLGFKSGESIELCPAQHGERNAITNAAKNGISINGATIYCYCGLPCQQCAGALINAGIKRVVCLQEEEHYDSLAQVLFMRAHVEIVYMTL